MRQRPGSKDSSPLLGSWLQPAWGRGTSTWPLHPVLSGTAAMEGKQAWVTGERPGALGTCPDGSVTARSASKAIPPASEAFSMEGVGGHKGATHTASANELTSVLPGAGKGFTEDRGGGEGSIAVRLTGPQRSPPSWPMRTDILQSSARPQETPPSLPSSFGLNAPHSPSNLLP